MILVIGIDGATYDIVNQLDLPNIKFDNVRSIGSYAASMPSWTSMITGVNVETHGMSNMLPEFTSDKCRTPRIWDLLKHYRIGVMNLPGTWPPLGINGWIVSGRLTPKGAIYAHPPRLSKELSDIGYRIDLDMGYYSGVVPYPNIPPEIEKTLPLPHVFAMGDYTDLRNTIRDEFCDILPKRTEGAIYLHENHPVDLMIVVYTCLDMIQHLYFHDQDVVKEWYEKVDVEVGKLVSGINPDERMIVSDHGFQLSKIDELRTGNHLAGAIFVAEKQYPRVTHIINVFDAMLGHFIEMEDGVKERLRLLGYID